MFLFLTITMLSLLITYAMEISDWLHLEKLFVPDVPNVAQELSEELSEAQATLRSADLLTDFGVYQQNVRASSAAKIKNLERRIISEQVKVHKNATKQLGARYVLRVVLSFMLGITSILNRYTPVMVFDDRINFEPLGAFLSFPCGVSNAISVPVWVLTCNMTFRHIAGILQSKQKI